MTQKKKPSTILGFTWYRQEEWEAVKLFCEDGNKMDPTYEIWEREARKAMRQIRATGQETVAVDFDLEEFKAWCVAFKKKPVATSRSEYTVYKLRVTT